MSKENSIIDWEAFGVLLKSSRISNGYRRGADLCEEVERRCGICISERTIYALESATRTPSADFFLALQQVLPELRDPEYMKPIFKSSGIEVMLIVF